MEIDLACVEMSTVLCCTNVAATGTTIQYGNKSQLAAELVCTLY